MAEIKIPDLTGTLSGQFGGLGIEGPYKYNGKIHNNDSPWWDLTSTDSVMTHAAGSVGGADGLLVKTGENRGFDFGSFLGLDSKAKAKDGKNASGGLLGGLGSMMDIGSSAYGIYSGMQALDLAKNDYNRRWDAYDQNTRERRVERDKFEKERTEATDRYFGRNSEQKTNA